MGDADGTERTSLQTPAEGQWDAPSEALTGVLRLPNGPFYPTHPV